MSYGEYSSDTYDKGLITLCVPRLPSGVSENELRCAFEEMGSVEVVHIAVNLNTRTIEKCAYVVVNLFVFINFMLHTNPVLRGNEVKFHTHAKGGSYVNLCIKQVKEFRPPVADWPKDVRPGHPAYQLPEPSEEPFDVDSPDQDRPSAHSLIDDVLLIVFKKLKVCELLRIERTCRRWQWMVRRILGGHKIVDFTDKTSMWGDFILPDTPRYQRPGALSCRSYFGPTFVHKVLILNSRTLEHLIIVGNLPIDMENICRAIKQCCPKLNHYTQALTESRSFCSINFVQVGGSEFAPNCTHSTFSKPLGGGPSRQNISNLKKHKFANFMEEEKKGKKDSSLSCCNVCMSHLAVNEILPKK